MLNCKIPGDSRTIADAVAIALAGISCRSLEVALAICVIGPGDCGCRDNVRSVACEPGLIVPNWNSAVPAFHSIVPTLAVLVSKTRFGPIGTLKMTLVAGLGPGVRHRRPKIHSFSGDDSRRGHGEKHTQIDRRDDRYEVVT